jgi:hypothetical protein
MDRISDPIPVEIKNWAPPVKPPFVKNTTVRTYVLDPAGAVGVGKSVQISDYETTRLRMSILVIDAAVALSDAPPVTSPGVSTASAAPGDGAYLPPNATAPMYDFFGPDAFWLNSLGTITRVTVIKEYGR